MTAKTDPIDPRQRQAAAILLAAMTLPVEMHAWADQIAEAAKVWPKMTTIDALIGDRRAALKSARDLIDACLAEIGAAP